MANTFYRIRNMKSEPLLNVNGNASSTSAKQYIMHISEFRDHTIWKSSGFWDQALEETVRQQLDLQDALKWDDLGQTILIENVINVHNLIFSQLVSLAFTMHELGLEFHQVVHQVEELARRFELSEDQRIELYMSTESNVNSVPLPVPAPSSSTR